MLSLRGLEVRYGAHVALQGVDLDLAPGEVVAVLGANGAGKSSLLRALLGLAPARGSYRLDGEEVGPLMERGLTEALAARGLVLVPERGGVFRTLTVRENLLLGGFLRPDGRKERVQEALALFPPLAERLEQRVGTMSGGEQRMVALARALVQAPRYLLLDEPTLGLAPLFARRILESLEHFARKGVGVLLVEQNAHLALQVAQRGYVLERGRVVLREEAQALLRHPWVQKAYLGV
ncbi:ABC transporter ATP-binding protein [Thermus oshimai]|jgi:branched-chain amino acid transport system ATP-binding protein